MGVTEALFRNEIVDEIGVVGIDPRVQDSHPDPATLVTAGVDRAGAYMLDPPGVVQLGINDMHLNIKINGGDVRISAQPIQCLQGDCRRYGL